MKSRVPIKLFLWKNQNFLIAQEQKLSTRADWVMLEHSLVIILRKIKKLKILKTILYILLLSERIALMVQVSYAESYFYFYTFLA